MMDNGMSEIESNYSSKSLGSKSTGKIKTGSKVSINKLLRSENDKENDGVTIKVCCY
jgi:hypothetical protein